MKLIGDGIKQSCSTRIHIFSYSSRDRLVLWKPQSDRKMYSYSHFCVKFWENSTRISQEFWNYDIVGTEIDLFKGRRGAAHGSHP